MKRDTKKRDSPARDWTGTFYFVCADDRRGKRHLWLPRKAMWTDVDSGFNTAFLSDSLAETRAYLAAARPRAENGWDVYIRAVRRNGSERVPDGLEP
jgi:hypothetical protein